MDKECVEGRSEYCIIGLLDFAFAILVGNW